VLFCLLNVFLLAECHFVRSWLILPIVILHCIDVICHSVILLNVVAPSMTEECVCIKFLMLTLVKRNVEPFLYPTVMTQLLWRNCYDATVMTQSKTLNKVISFCLFFVVRIERLASYLWRNSLIFFAGNACWRGRLSTVDLLLLTSSFNAENILFILN
jgi:hypothetical protein